MISVGGNTTAMIQTKASTQTNVIGEPVIAWANVGNVIGWLDYQSGEASYANFKGKVEETSHIFVCDAKKWTGATQGASVHADNSRLVIGGENYNILFIDNPMGLNQHMEIYMKYIGGGLNG